MIVGAAQQDVAEVVLRLVALPTTSIERVLIERGLDPNSLDAAKDAIASVGFLFSPADVVAFSFRKVAGTPPYRVGRFGNGNYAVFYSALEEETCIEEMRHYCRIWFERLRVGAPPYPRYYQMIACDFAGKIVNLTGREVAYSDLISTTETGYPFCQSVAIWAIGLGANALHTASARRLGGVCTPVFSKACVNNARITDRFCFYIQQGQVIHEKIY